jgi:hypothetical protein
LDSDCQTVGFSEHDKEVSDLIYGKEFIIHLTKCHLLKVCGKCYHHHQYEFVGVYDGGASYLVSVIGPYPKR